MLKEIGKQTFDWAVKNAPTIFTVAGAAGVVLTAVAAGKASIKAKEALDDIPEDTDIKEKAKVVAPIMAKPFLMGVFTIFCIFYANHEHLRREAALAAAFTASSKALDEYEAKVVDTIGKSKNGKIKDAIAEDAVNANPPTSDMLVDGDGKILCYDKWSARYFRIKPEGIDKALNYIGHIENAEGYVCLNEWYDRLNEEGAMPYLDGTENGDYIGWNGDEDGLVELESPWEQSCVLYKDEYPVRVLTFSVKPKEYFDSAC